MIATLRGLWIDALPPPEQFGAPLRVREAQAIDWPQGEDGAIVLTLTDVLGQPVVLDLAGADSAKLYVSWDLRSGPQVTLSATVGIDPGVYLFTLTPPSTASFFGPMVFGVSAVKAGLTQQVVPLGYFTVVQGAASP